MVMLRDLNKAVGCSKAKRLFSPVIGGGSVHRGSASKLIIPKAHIAKKYSSLISHQFLPRKNHVSFITNSLNSFKHYSTTSLISNTPEEEEDVVEYQFHDFTMYHYWSTEKVCYLLCEKEECGGAGLSDEMVKGFYEAKFDGHSVQNIVSRLMLMFVPLSEIVNDYSKWYPDIQQDTIKRVIVWVEKILKTKLLHEWTIGYLCKQAKDETLSKLFARIHFCIWNLIDVVRDLNTDGMDYAIKNIEKKFRISRISPTEAKSVALWCYQFSFKSKFQTYLERNNFSNADKELFHKIIDSLSLEQLSENDFVLLKNLFPLIEKLENAMNLYSSTTSKDQFNSMMEPYGLNKEDSLIRLNVSESPSSSPLQVCCDLAPTIQQEKYKQKQLALQDSYLGIHLLLTLLDPPGSGKIHFASHLARDNKYLVLPIDKATWMNLILKLKKKKNKDCEEFDHQFEMSGFHEFMIGLSRFIYRYCKANFPNHEQVLHRNILRFLTCEFKDEISKLNQTMKSVMKHVKKVEDLEIVWLLEEPQTLELLASEDARYLMSKLTYPFRSSGPVVLTSTYKFVDGKIDYLITPSCSKVVIELFSYDFSYQLPLLHMNQVVPYLENFIRIDRNDDIWKLVSYLLQGQFARSTTFLQTLFQNSSKYSYTSRNALIYDSLSFLFENSIQEESNLKHKYDPDYRDFLFKLALLGNCKLNSCRLSASDYLKSLMQLGISFEVIYEPFTTFSISPIERIKIMKALQKIYGEDWISHVESKRLRIAYKIMKNFNSIISKYFRDSDYISKYELKGTFLLTDSKPYRPEEETVQISTLILNTIRDNMNEMNIDNSYPLIGYGSNNGVVGYKTEKMESKIDTTRIPEQVGVSNILPQLVANLCENVGPDIIGMLMLKSEFSNSTYPKCIPLIMSISLEDDLLNWQHNYQSSNIENMYCGSATANELNERAKIEDAIQSISKSGKLLRILVHSKAKPTTSIHERMQRIAELSNNKDSVNESEIPSENSVILPNGNCVVELYQKDLDQFTK